ncbi:hypothetical protein LSTR_LSTR011726 [Laodelphax striatellus]|uniref:Uncharacterized protein n=1 Tax=Laodelphax striatellus TaxID=195883 RepID=A0A482WLV4_LAOST|nr:hypothetical protein LSTR_LSTR011726 [Laodelphax striatellus]
MEVAPHLVMKRDLPPPPPFQRRDVQEWSHLDSVTGARETGRVETGRWAATTSNSSHHFGQVVDLRARNRADGSQEQRRQKKQLEVFQASIPGGSVQVIRSQTTTSSWHGQSTTTSKLESGMPFGWSHALSNSSSQSKSTEKRTTDEPNSQASRSDDKSGNRVPDMHFDNLQLAIHPLDLSPQKTKASIGRSGSISSRRPPTRPRSIAGTGQDSNTRTTTIKDQQQHRWQSSSASSLVTKSSSETKSVFSSNNTRENILNPVSLFSITGNRGDVDLFPVRLEDEGNKKKLFRMKSCSSEDLRLSPDSNHEDTSSKTGTEHEWRRDSLERRSLQLPPVQPKSSDKRQTNVMRSRFESHTFSTDAKPKDVENQTVIDRLKGTGWKSIEDVLKKNFDDQLSNSRTSLVDGMISPSEERIENRSNVTKKKNTFITVESLNAVRGRLRRTDSFSELLPGVERSIENIAPVEQVDDGILTEPLQSNTSVNDLGKSDPKSVKSFVYGIETVLQGDRRTGSLETRGTNKNDGSNGLTSKTEEWYNRRKSYGFEPVRQQQQQSIANRYSSNLNTKINLAESTDSGICRSSETVANTTPWYTPTTVSNKFTDNNESRKTSHTITIKNSFNYDNLLSDSKSSSRIEQLSKGIGSKGKKTVVTVGNEEQDNWRNSVKNEEEEIEKDHNKFETSNGTTSLNSPNVNINLQEPVLKDEEREIVPRGKVADALRSLREKSSLMNSFAAKRLSEPITISIPSPVEDSENTEVNDFLLKQTKDPLEADRYKFKKFLDSETKNVQTSYSKLIFGEGKIKTLSKSFDGQADNEFNSNHETPLNKFNLRPVSKINQPEFKRHSIAVDETKYITNKNKDTFELSSAANDHSNFRLNSSNSTFVSPYTSKLKPSDQGFNKGESSGENDSNDKKQKKVEFCKTEVHFAAEPGRFNIVETDGKPPSNMNFRRRRKTISESTPRNNSNLPEIRFGDLQYEKALLTNKNEILDDGFSVQNMQKEENLIAAVPKDDVITIVPETIHSVSSKIDENVEKSFNSALLSDLECDPSYDDNKTLDMNMDNHVRPRSILKCNASHATSNENQNGQYFVALVSDDKHTSNHGIVRLNANDDSFIKPTFLDQKGFVKSNEIQVSRSSSKTTITSDLKSRSDCEEQVETELQKLLKSLRPTPRKSLFSTDDELSDSGSNYPPSNRYRNSLSEHNSSMAADNGLAVHISSKPTWSSRSPNATENIHRIEDFKSKGFSTRVNFGSEETMVVNSESVKKGLPIEQMTSPYSTEVSSRILTQPSNSSDNNVGVLQDDNAVCTTAHVRFNAAPDLNHRLTTNKHKEIVVTTSPSIVNSSSDNENISSASLVLKMLLNRAAQSRRIQKSDEQGNEGNAKEPDTMKKDGKFQNFIEDGVSDMKPTTQFYTAHTSVTSHSNVKDNKFEKSKSSPSTEQRMMKMINSQHKQHLDLIKEMDKYNVSGVKSEEIGIRNGLDADEREERLSRISNDSILEALENLSKQIENDIIEIPKIKNVKKEVKSKDSVFKVIEDSGDTRMKRFLRRRTDSSLSQSQLSDDTLQADEEVKSYMSAVSDVKRTSDSSDSDDKASKTKNCDRLTNSNRRNRRLVKNRTKEPCTSQFTQGIISQPKNKIPDDIPKGQTTAKFYNDATKDKLNSDKSVETLVSTRSGHPRITSISLRYNDSHETNGGTSFDTSTANNRYSKNSICIEPCDSSSSTTDISSSWKWSKGTKQSVRTSTQNVSLSNIYSNATTIEPVSSREDITSFPEDDTKTPALSYPKTKTPRTDTEHYQRKQVVKSASDQCVLLSTDKPQFGKVTAVVPPTVAYSSSVVLNYQPSPTHELQMSDNITTHNVVRSHHTSSTSTNVDRKRSNKSEIVGVEKSKIVSEQRNVDKYRKNVSSSVMNSGRRDSWMNLPKEVSTNQVEQTRQSREVRVDKQQRKKSTTAVDVRRRKKSTDDNGSIEGCSDDLTTHFRGRESPITVHSKGRESPVTKHSKGRESPITTHSKGRESPIYANSRVFTHDYTAPSCSDRVETESLILEELTKAADEILRAVNGYTDDDSSFKGSSDEEPGKRYGKERRFSSKPLGSISETPTKKESSKSQVVESKVRSTVVKNRLCKTSSNSSMEGGGSSADSKQLIMEKPSKRRNVRLLQRASSREMLMKSRGAASSSEDVQSGSELPAPPPRVARTRTSRHTSHQKSTIASQSRTKERVQKTVSSADNSSVKAQSTVISAASNNITRARHDARKRSTTKSKTSTTSSITASSRRLGGRQSPEGAEQKKEAAVERLPRDEPQPRLRPATVNRTSQPSRTAANRTAAVYVPRTTSRRNHARRKQRKRTAARTQQWPQCPCV